MALAVYNSIILDIRFPHVCYRKLLSPAVVPYNVPNATVGVTKVTLDDLRQTFPVSYITICSTVKTRLKELFEGIVSIKHVST